MLTPTDVDLFERVITAMEELHAAVQTLTAALLQPGIAFTNRDQRPIEERGAPIRIIHREDT